MPPVAHDVKVISIGMFVAEQPAGGLARADAAPRPAAVPRRRLLGRPRRPADGPAARHRRHRDLGGPAGAVGRAARRHHPAAGRRRGGRAGRHRSRCRPTSRSPASSRTCPGCPARTATSGSRCSAAAAARRSPTGSRRTLGARCRCSARSRSTAAARGRRRGPAARARPTRTPRRPLALTKVADTLGHRARGLVGRSLGLEPRGPLTPLACGWSSSYRRAARPVAVGPRALARSGDGAAGSSTDPLPPTPSSVVEVESGSSRCLRTRLRGLRSPSERSFSSGPSSRVTSVRASLAIRRSCAQHPGRLGGVARAASPGRARAARRPRGR